MHQECLAGHEIERSRFERHRLGTAEPIAETLVETGQLGTFARFLDPSAFAIDADESQIAGQDLGERTAPMSDAATDIEDLLQLVGAPSRGQHRKEVLVPPMLARLAEVLRRMAAEATKVVAHAHSIKWRPETRAP